MATKHEVAGWTYFTRDVDESLTKIQAPDTTLSNKYNSRMQRVNRDEDGTAEKLLYDTQKLIGEAGVSGLSHYYLSEGGSVYSPLVSQTGSQEWFLFDALGSTIGLTGGAGSLSDTFRYEAFGTSLGRTGMTATPYQYVGGYGYFDEPTVGLEQVWWRWYRAWIGMFASRDRAPYMHSAHQRLSRRSGLRSERLLVQSSVRDRQSMYAYARRDPVSNIDPTGLEWYHKHPHPWLNPDDNFDYEGYNNCMDGCVPYVSGSCSVLGSAESTALALLLAYLFGPGAIPIIGGFLAGGALSEGIAVVACDYICLKPYNEGFGWPSW